MTNGDPEPAIRAALAARDYQSAATGALEAYGRELMSFLAVRLRNVADAEEAFSIFVEDFWKGLPEFELRCSVRIWMYTLARNAGNRHLRAARRKREHNLTPFLRETFGGLVDRARSDTRIELRTEAKDKLRAFRDQLEPDDQLLLVLRVDRALAWRDVAVVIHQQGEQLTQAALEREITRVRKRYERIKAALRELARREGL